MKIRNVGALASGATAGFFAGRKDARDQGVEDRMKALYDAHQSAYKELGSFMDKYGAKNAGAVFEPQDEQAAAATPSFTGAAAADAASQPPGQFAGATPAINNALMQPATPFITDTGKKPRQIMPLAYPTFGG